MSATVVTNPRGVCMYVFYVYLVKFFNWLALYMFISASKRIMGAAGVPLVPGYHGNEQDIDFMKSEGEKIGYPVLIKPTHGGGGKVCHIPPISIIFDVILSLISVLLMILDVCIVDMMFLCLPIEILHIHLFS